MITTSDAWKEYAKNNFIYHIKAVLTPSSGSALNLTDEDFMMGSVRFNDSTSDSNTFTIGGVITNTFDATLNNFSGKFDDINFDKATISVQLGIVFEDKTEEWINKGVYTVDKPSSLGSTIQLTCYDYMDKLNTYYIGKRWKFYTPGDYSTAELIDIAFPQTAETMMQYLCDYCHVSWDASSWDLGSFTVNKFECDESTTCRQVLGWILQCCGGFAKVSPLGAIRCTWYNAKVWASETNLDGGLISENGVWGASDTADGGTMWVAVASYDGGEMLSGSSVELNKVASTTVGVDDIRITGVRAYANGTVDEFQFETVGEGGYVLALQDNPLITADNMLAVATLVYNQVKDLQFRIFNLSAWASPDIEAGDSCLIQDYRGKVYPSIITNVTYNLNGLSDMSCGAETPGENSLEIANPQTQTIAGATRAAYDYITAKKISADYISAGTIEASVVAKNLTMEGGTLNITAEGRNDAVINLNWESNLIKTYTVLAPNFISNQFKYNTNDLTALLSGGIIKITNNSSGTDTVTLSGASGTGNFASSVTASSFINSSRIDLKENLQKVDSVLSKIKSADILSFNFKDEADDKKHIGLAVGGKYNAPEEVISTNENGEEQGVDLYSMVSMSWKAIQEQQTIIEELEKRIEVLERKLNPIGTIKDIIKGDTDGDSN